MLYKIKRRIFQIIELDNPGDTYSKTFKICIITLIFLSILVVIISTVEEIYQPYKTWLDNFELISVIIFTIEYILRVWSSNVAPGYKHPIWGRIRFIIKPLAIIDLIAILPFYLPLFWPNLIFTRSFRLFRIFRLFKISRYSDTVKLFGKVIKSKQEEIVITLFIALVLLVTSASLIYFAEHEAQPDDFPHIPAAMWWGIITLTTVGYGDVYPITPLGRFLGAIAALVGVGIFALPAGIVASGFTEEIEKKRASNQNKKSIICPHCGQKIDEE
ncbi:MULTISPECIES: ion transporter [Okeania]|uniref:ion transporter n=2 Tax=Microcoleaceae TaxID=1892252 RepID=UPI000F52E242|nr:MULTISPECIES: ion transporter [Okeania]NET14343.1 ion transporter [Okeania sp. SIO1H6]NES75372.1 ion transporter [Okeania sp. SIO1H4]NET19089.1 ion transporter [Okeania sp. SIO1H5]NET78469.1 ion transporter [Okeania sp. SIO1F9]NET92862.1 ion transporter [Okeania sp. SIO1H2]